MPKVNATVRKYSRHFSFTDKRRRLRIKREAVGLIASQKIRYRRLNKTANWFRKNQ